MGGRPIGSLESRLKRAEENSRQQAIAEIRHYFACLSDREVARIIAEPGASYDPRIERLLSRVGDSRRVSEIVGQLGVFERKGSINRHLNWSTRPPLLKDSRSEEGL